MIDMNGYNEVNAANHGENSKKLPAGGYVCKILEVTPKKSKAGRAMLVLNVDIAEGEFRGYFTEQHSRSQEFNPDAFYPSAATYYQLIYQNDSDKISPYFKGLITTIERSNNCKLNIKDKFDEQELKGKICGFIFADEEYTRNDGKVIVAPRIKFPKSADDIRQNKFTVPELKKATETPQKSEKADDPMAKNAVEVSDSDLPF